MNKKALGKGLSSLIPNKYEHNVSAVADIVEKSADGFVRIPINKIIPNPDQPRTRFNQDELEELSASIQEQGVIQPVIVTASKADDHTYELVCGERRWRAAEKAGLTEIPALVKDIAPDNLLEIALIENIQRKDLNAVEEAHGYLKLVERGLSHEEIAKRVGKNRTTVVNTLRLLKLPIDVLNLVIDNKLSEGHARALLSLTIPDYQRRLAKRIIEEQLSVREVEHIIKRKAYQKRPAKRLRKIDAQILDLERKLEERLGSKVRIFAGKSKGRIEVKYFSLDDLDRILNVIGVAVD